SEQLEDERQALRFALRMRDDVAKRPYRTIGVPELLAHCGLARRKQSGVDATAMRLRENRSDAVHALCLFVGGIRRRLAVGLIALLAEDIRPQGVGLDGSVDSAGLRARDRPQGVDGVLPLAAGIEVGSVGIGRNDLRQPFGGLYEDFVGVA